MKELIKALEAKINKTPSNIKLLSSLTGESPEKRKKLPFKLGVSVLKYDTLVVFLYAVKAYTKLGADYDTNIAKALKLDIKKVPSYLDRAGELRATLFNIIDKCGFDPTAKESDDLIEFAVRNVFVLAPQKRRPYFLGNKRERYVLAWDYTEIDWSAGCTFGYAMEMEKYKQPLKQLGIVRDGVTRCSGTVQPDLI